MGVIAIILPNIASAAAPCPDTCKFGCFEVLPGEEKCIDKVVKGSDGGFIGAINFVVKLVLGAAVGLGLIMIVIGGYVYMTAGGNASRVGTAKTMIMSALLGIVLAIAASLILNTISPQFSADIRLPF